jgi:hypothetical protein
MNVSISIATETFRGYVSAFASLRVCDIAIGGYSIVDVESRRGCATYGVVFDSKSVDLSSRTSILDELLYVVKHTDCQH